MTNSFPSLTFGPIYVVGFALSLQGINLAQQVLLVLKKRPADQHNKFNGIGGRVNIGESPVQAMVRKFREETGLSTTKDDWHSFHYERRPSGVRLHFYTTTALGADIWKAQSTTDEEPRVLDIRTVLYYPHYCVHDVPYLVLMAKSWLLNPDQRYLEG